MNSFSLFLPFPFKGKPPYVVACCGADMTFWGGRRQRRRRKRRRGACGNPRIVALLCHVRETTLAWMDRQKEEKEEDGHKKVKDPLSSSIHTIGIPRSPVGMPHEVAGTNAVMVPTYIHYSSFPEFSSRSRWKMGFFSSLNLVNPLPSPIRLRLRLR